MTALKDIGALRRRLTLEEPVETSDGAGGVTRGYVAVATLWAEVTPVSARADITADSSGAVVRLHIVIRMRAGLTTRRTGCPVSGQTDSASSWNPWRTSKRVPSARSYS